MLNSTRTENDKFKPLCKQIARLKSFFRNDYRTLTLRSFFFFSHFCVSLKGWVQNGVKPFRTKDFFASGTSLTATTLSIPTFPFLTTQRPSTATRWTK